MSAPAARPPAPVRSEGRPPAPSPTPSTPPRSAPSSPPSDGAASAGVPPAAPLERILASLAQMAEDASLPRNIRRGAQGAREALTKNGVPVDVRVAGAVGVLDDLANDSNIPVHGRTAIWSLISQLESLQ